MEQRDYANHRLKANYIIVLTHYHVLISITEMINKFQSLISNIICI